MRHLKYVLAILCLCVPSLLVADQFYSVADPKTKKPIDCSYKNLKVAVGTLKGNPPRFRSLMITINALKKRIVRSSKKVTLRKRLKELQTEYARQLKICKQNRPAVPSPTPTAPPDPAPPKAKPAPAKIASPTVSVPPRCSSIANHPPTSPNSKPKSSPLTPRPTRKRCSSPTNSSKPNGVSSALVASKPKL